MKLALALAAGTVAASTMTLTANAGTDGATTPVDDSPFAAMLALAPESAAELGGTTTIQYTDLAALWRRAGVEGSAEQRLAAFRQISWIETFPQPPYLFRNQLLEQDPLTEVGFAVQHMEQELALVQPPDDLIIVSTSASADAITAAVESDPVWSGELTTVSSAGGEYYGWGDDGARQDLTRRSTFRPLGQAGFLAALGGVPGDQNTTVVRSIQTEQMEAALATVAGRAPSLAESWLFEPVLAAVAEREVLFAMALPSPMLADPLATISPDELLDSGSLPEPASGLLPYLGIVIVGTAEGTDAQADIFLVHLSADDAAANVERAAAWLDGNSPMGGRPISELLPGATVNSEGVLLRVTVPGQQSYLRAVNMLFSRELMPMGA